ncbi:MAG: AMP-binding protein [Firmicutes bacterium]|nr:AMP-binding protein [Bacillota bacterium]
MKTLPELKKRFNATLYENMRELIADSARKYADNVAFIIKHKGKKGEEPTYDRITFKEFREDINNLGTALMKRGLIDQRVAVISKNRYEWMVSFFAVLSGNGMVVPLDKGLPYEEFESCMVRSRAKVLIYGNDMKSMVEELKKSGKGSCETYICMDELGDELNLPALLEEGKAASEEEKEAFLNTPIDGDAIEILLFTSGHTSMAKAVMLSQKNITNNVYSLQLTEDVRSTDTNMAFLPYHHTFGSVGQTYMLVEGAATAYCDGLKYLQRNIVEYKVSVFFCVPLLIEGIYKKIQATVKKQGKENTVKFGIKLTKFLMKFGIDVRRKVFKQILDQLGGELRMVITGAAAIDPEAIEGFNNLGIIAVQGFGMTEASPVISAENAWEQKTGSCGRAMPNVEVAIDNPDENGIGEIIARGPNVMYGYYENEEATAETLVDGWLHTGDLGRIDEDGFIFICGRKKNVIVLKNGKNVFPEEIEQLISNLPYVEENFVFGLPRNEEDDRDLVVCTKIVYNKEYMKSELGLDNSKPEDLKKIEDLIKADMDKISEGMPVYKHILRTYVTDEPMIKTTTNKVKRFEEIKKLQK